MTTVYCILTIPEPLFVGQTCSDNKIQFNCEDLQTEGIKIKPIKDDIFNKEQIKFIVEGYSKYINDKKEGALEFAEWLDSQRFLSSQIQLHNVKPIE